MNILPKKRWHVRTKENVARVRRDEAQAAEQAKAEAARQALAEQEFRTNLMRSKAADRRAKDDAFSVDNTTAGPSNSVPTTSSTSEPVNTAPITDASGHVNFFADLEHQERTFGASKAHEEEKKKEKEDFERKIGLLKYLGEGSGESSLDKEKPFWMSVPSHRSSLISNAKQPLPDFMQKLQEKAKSSVSTVKPPVSTITLDATESSKSSKKHHKRDKKEKKHRKSSKSHKKSSDKSRSSSRKRHRNESTSSVDEPKSKKSRKSRTKSKRRKSRSPTRSLSSDTSEDSLPCSLPKSNPNIVKLRAERLARESAERAKTEALLRKAAGLPELKSGPEKKDKPVYKQRYNSQFNPELAKQNAL